ncbi:AcrR family transcriptional regulator [Actinoplanes lutulentus]|uniref:TetR family transcriptional regulator n=1 Tax=Actinoplanes lutulentus TaxID=1287878 RepID=A0A327ZLG2_9ACTN|nr:TetR/AcrR family transcriptional regulator [Actinoplanes lutulentus]MBB2940852.1 AcrR family transcriptional regulator [Actinoplanes lutulentus]RAK43161.1 TetR family transcriptional regulator [Actinoplanes lutulentus]
MSTSPEPLLSRAFQEAARRARTPENHDDPGSGESPGQPDDPYRERILVAAAEQFRTLGIRRSSMDDVARRAGVSRITVYRRFAAKTALVDELLLRELRDYVAEFRRVVGEQTTGEGRLVEGFVASLRAARGNRLVSGLLVADPETVVPLMTTEGGPVLGAVRDFVAGQLRHDQDDGLIPATVDTGLVAEVVARLALSFFVTPESRVDVDDDDQLRSFARTVLGPLVAPTGASDTR